VLKKILNRLGYYKKANGTYREIRYFKPGTPKENSERFIKLAADGHSWIRERTQQDYEFIGMFFTIVLLIEYKISQLLVDFDPEIESKMFGKKVEVYKDFLKTYQPKEGENIDDYRNLISPLRDIKELRDAMAHDISKSKFACKDIKHIENYVNKMRPDLLNSLKESKDENPIGVIAAFGFIFAVEIAKLRMSIA
jgi:hypothetical protein